MGEARKVGNSHETYEFVAHDRVLYDCDYDLLSDLHCVLQYTHT